MQVESIEFHPHLFKVLRQLRRRDLSAFTQQVAPEYYEHKFTQNSFKQLCQCISIQNFNTTQSPGSSSAEPYETEDLNSIILQRRFPVTVKTSNTSVFIGAKLYSTFLKSSGFLWMLFLLPHFLKTYLVIIVFCFTRTSPKVWTTYPGQKISGSQQ